MHEERGCAQVGQVLRALLLGLSRRMERIREQEKAANKLRFLGAEHAGLTSAIRVAAEKEFASLVLAGQRIPTSRNVSEKWGTHNFP
jgi:hypothetical protein